MPLLKGKKNIGHNIAVEEKAGKPRKQAIAIALHTAAKDKWNSSQAAHYLTRRREFLREMPMPQAHELAVKEVEDSVDPIPVGDEHIGFEKLKEKISHEKGVNDPATVAAAIGRKKYGQEGMAKKSAAGRAKDEVLPV